LEKEDIIKYLNTNKVKNAEVLIDFLNKEEDHYSRETLSGHITGSSFIVNDSLDQALLILHKKYNKWLSPGGHVDQNETAKVASNREATEEVGLSKLQLLKPEIFDIDIHKIGESIKNGKIEPEHWHFDVRYLYKAEKDCKVEVNIEETNGYKWNDLKMLAEVDDPSISRQAKKAIEFAISVKNKKIIKPKF